MISRVVTVAAALHYTDAEKAASWQTSSGCRVIQEVSQKLSGEAIILMYHHCAPLPPQAAIRGLYVTPRQFAWQMDWLRRRNVRFCTLNDLQEAEAAAPRRPRVVVTFDDGLRDVYENAFPMLAERRIPAVVFPVVGDIGKSDVVWDENKDKSPQSLMSEAQIREMADAGTEFGSHLWEHRNASRLAPVELREQLTRSRNELARITGRATTSIAYPYGDYSAEVLAETARAGYRYGVTTKEGSNRGVPLLELRRHAIKGVSLLHPLRFIRTMRRALAAART
ncbi:MAG: polysaccharide deacetylase family protein [Gammaproteobacteria bacterium]|nr:polysaccharide deacetylase family protein [Gammaproteobacteria bacterium]